MTKFVDSECKYISKLVEILIVYVFEVEGADLSSTLKETPNCLLVCGPDTPLIGCLSYGDLGPPEEIKRYQVQTSPIIQSCRANWYY